MKRGSKEALMASTAPSNENYIECGTLNEIFVAKSEFLSILLHDLLSNESSDKF